MERFQYTADRRFKTLIGACALELCPASADKVSHDHAHTDGKRVDCEVFQPRMATGHEDLHDLYRGGKKDEARHHHERSSIVANAESQPGNKECREMFEVVRQFGFRAERRRNEGHDSDHDGEAPRPYPSQC